IVVNLLPASAEMLGRSNMPLLTATATATPTPTFTPTPEGQSQFLPTPTLLGQLQLLDARNVSNQVQRTVVTPIPAGVIISPIAMTAVATPLATATMIISADVRVSINVNDVIGEISQGIYGLSEPPEGMIDTLRPSGISLGGNNSVRYNWRAGNYWNSARDYEWRNGTYGKEGMYADQFLQQAMDNNIASRLTIPTLGWVAKDWWSCSFPDEDGNCQTIDHYTDCNNPILVADPYATSIESTPDDIREWMQYIKAQNLAVTYAAMGNEPELYGFSHYDVHPKCTTFQEILDGQINYAQAVKDVLPDTKLVGPATCCWHFYWQSAAGLEDKAKHGYQDFLPWFLSQLQQYEQENGTRLLDVLDIHYYPEGLYEIKTEDENEEIAAQRIRSVRSLWDPTYVDESWVNEPVRLLPRMKELIDTYYPGTAFGISEWNFGNDVTMGGAIALADALAQFGIHDVEYAYYWRYPDWDTPGYNAFRMFTNFDWQGGNFGDLAILARSDDEMVTTYAALDRKTGDLHILLLNKYRTEAQSVAIELDNFKTKLVANQFYYDETTPAGIEWRLLEVGENTV
ncbi:MAG TPA: hypothetical protein ENJ56_05650, partial [Anaerolineae bacterium]|nr:hypothetical protein [Anaerolineae bacterium]